MIAVAYEFTLDDATMIGRLPAGPSVFASKAKLNRGGSSKRQVLPCGFIKLVRSS